LTKAVHLRSKGETRTSRELRMMMLRRLWTILSLPLGVAAGYAKPPAASRRSTPPTSAPTVTTAPPCATVRLSRGTPTRDNRRAVAYPNLITEPPDTTNSNHPPSPPEPSRPPTPDSYPQRPYLQARPTAEGCWNSTLILCCLCFRSARPVSTDTHLDSVNYDKAQISGSPRGSASLPAKNAAMAFVKKPFNL